ncbi:MAG: PhnD/SsuA/transferrin family substrate-binding protein [Candidatus Schekmanbacteria bacterium]|nr:PhnD/SsuA/transferrin family substrate-binding protein [Candidatus Schekmanbacteria bacterium]
MASRPHFFPGYLARAAGALLLLPFILLSAIDPPAAAAREKRQVVYYFPDTIGEDHTAVATYFQAWLDVHLSHALGYDLRLSYFNRLQDLQEFMEGCVSNDDYPLFGILHAQVMLDFYKEWKIDILGIPVSKQGKTTQRISVVVRKDSDIKTLEDMRGRSLVAPVYWGRDVTTFEERVLAGKVRFSQLSRVSLAPSSISALMGLVYRQDEVALVSHRVIDVMRERVAPVWRGTRVIHQSEPIPIGGVATFPGLSRRDREIIIERGLVMHETAEGKKWFDYTGLLRYELGGWRDLFSQEDLAVAGVNR